MITTLSKKLIFLAQQNTDYTISTFNQTLIAIDLTKYQVIVSDEAPIQGSYNINLKAKPFPNIQVLINQFISNPNTNAINLYFAIFVDDIGELGQLQTIPAGVNNYLVKDTISPLFLNSYLGEAQQHMLSLYLAFPTNTGTTALTLNGGLYTNSPVQSNIKILI